MGISAKAMAKIEEIVRRYRGLEIGFWGPYDGLPDPRALVDMNWNPRERARVVRYLRSVPRGMPCMGSSHCRFGCYDGKMHGDMGSADMTDGTYTWPEGYVHYIERHGVRPPDEFVRHVLGQRGVR